MDTVAQPSEVEAVGWLQVPGQPGDSVRLCRWRLLKLAWKPGSRTEFEVAGLR